MDEELKAHLEAMEGRLMERITGLQEQMVERFRAVDARLGSLETNAQTIVMLLSSFDKRITNLEDKP